MVTREFRLPFAPDTYVGFVSGFVLEAGQFQSKIEICHGGRRQDAKSFLGLMSAGVPANTPFSLQIEGEDEGPALTQLAAFIERFR